MHRTIERVRAEFLEMPGLRLTVAQAQRLFGVEPSICQAVLDTLVSLKVLRLTSTGHYVRVTDGDTMARWRPAKADVRTERATKAS